MERMNFFVKGQKAAKALGGFPVYISRSSIDKNLQHLIYIRVSQINGCAYCLDMHTKDLRVLGETEQRMLMLGAWHEAHKLYSPRERAALAFAESLTKISNGGGVPDDVYAEAAAHFSDEELADLTIVIIAINSYNRINVAFRTPAGDYVPGQWATAAH